MLGIDEHATFRNVAFIDALLDFRGDVDKSPSGGYVEPQFISIAFHL